MTAPLTRPIPLRTSAVWGKYQTIETLPHVYGKVNVQPVPFDDTGRRWLLADHAIAGIDAVMVDDAPYAARELLNMTDSTGHPVAVLELYDPIDRAERIAALIRGKQDAGGALMTSPAHVLLDILQLHGLSYTTADIVEFYRACELDGLAVAGILDGRYSTGRAAIDAICRQVGAVWSLGLPGLARLWLPGTVPADAKASLEIGQGQGPVSADASADELRTRMVVSYAHDHAAGTAQRSMTLEASIAVEAYGELTEEIDADWLADARAVERVYTRRLQYQARPVWRVSIDVDERIEDFRYGDYVSINHPLSPLSGILPAVDAEIDIDTRTGRIFVEDAVGTAPAVAVTGQSVAVDSAPVRVRQIQESGVLIITATDNQGTALPGALVTIAGVTRVADSAGVARFSGIAPGVYVLTVASGDETFTLKDFEVT